MDISVRKLLVTEWRLLKNLRLKALKEEPTAFASSYKEDKKKSDEDWKRYLEGAWREDSSIMLFAEVDGHLVGILGAHWVVKKKQEHVAEVGMMYVDVDYRKNGIARKLFEEVEKKLKEVQTESGKRQIHKLKLEVNSQNKSAIALYKSLGFKHVGTLKDELLVGQVYYDIDIMEKILD
jgi:ribosomal protein S18 acetylase RimI-like enzyme